MNPPLKDNVWERHGINILWDGDTLTRLQAADKVISLRRFFELYEASWPEDDIPFINDSALVVAGLDVLIDSLSPELALEWLEQQVYSKIHDFQSVFDCALIFWMPEKDRWKENPSHNSYEWLLSAKFKNQLFPIGRCIWNGAQSDVSHIENQQGQWIGLYLHRIS